MIAKWQTMSKKDRLLYKLLFVFLVFTVYSLVIYPRTKARYDKADQFLSRKQDRIEKRTTLPDIPDIPNIKTLEKKIKKIDEEMKNYIINSEDLDTGFAPLDSDQMRQQLLLEISNLAERSGISLSSISRKQIFTNIDDPGIDPEIGRPILLLKGRGGFWNLISFLRGLEDLSFYSAVVNFKAYAFPLSGDGVKKISSKVSMDGKLYINLEMSI